MTEAASQTPGAQDLYELCVQSPRHVVDLVRAIHGDEPTLLGEDFAGSGAVSRAWVGQSGRHRAWCVDRDAETLSRCDGADRIETRVGDVMDEPASVDAIWVGNFSVGYHHDRASLLAYLKHVRARLKPGGVFVCDTYGGETAYTIGEVHRFHPLPAEHAPDGKGGWRVRYTWEQREANPLTGMVTNALHFRIERAGFIDAEHIDAFVYHWRLWSVPELRDALLEAGFASSAVYGQLPDAVDGDGRPYIQPMDDTEEADDSFIVCVAARA
ncbi:MAG: class I SAM-dependent methyltransferase [Phycisphaera sp.]|nr:MAG: class I SAM-dependent methyltransferase [Phycisphaera sp.]